MGKSEHDTLNLGELAKLDNPTIKRAVRVIIAQLEEFPALKCGCGRILEAGQLICACGE